MATKKAADSTLYHLSSKGVWKKFRDALVVNPEISTGLPIPKLNRYPPPGSRPEKYATPATKASDPAQNPYWKRDVRRAYPQLSMVTQEELSKLLLQSPEQQQAVAAPADGEEAKSSSVPASQPEARDFTSAIATIAAARGTYSESNLPPSLPTSFKRWTPESAPDAPHDPNTYFPMSLVK